MQGITQAGLTRTEIWQVLSRHYGKRAELARRLKVSNGAVTLYLNGKSASKRIERASGAMALRLLAEERRNGAENTTQSSVHKNLSPAGRIA